MRAIEEVQQGLLIIAEYDETVFYCKENILYAGLAKGKKMRVDDANQLIFLKWSHVFDEELEYLFVFNLPEK